MKLPMIFLVFAMLAFVVYLMGAALGIYGAEWAFHDGHFTGNVALVFVLGVLLLIFVVLIPLVRRK